MRESAARGSVNGGGNGMGGEKKSKEKTDVKLCVFWEGEKPLNIPKPEIKKQVGDKGGVGGARIKNSRWAVGGGGIGAHNANNPRTNWWSPITQRTIFFTSFGL